MGLWNDSDAIDSLTKAISELTAWLKANRNAITKQDLEAAKVEIIKAIGERVDRAAVEELKDASSELDVAVKANKPISGS